MHLLQGSRCKELRLSDGLGPNACSVPAGEVFQTGQAALHRRLHGVHPLLQRTRSQTQQLQMLQEPKQVNTAYSRSGGALAAARASFSTSECRHLQHMTQHMAQIPSEQGRALTCNRSCTVLNVLLPPPLMFSSAAKLRMSDKPFNAIFCQLSLSERLSLPR